MILLLGHMVTSRCKGVWDSLKSWVAKFQAKNSGLVTEIKGRMNIEDNYL